MTFHRALVDNGEFKGDLILKQVSDMEMGAHYGMTHEPINKAPGESGHQVTHRKVDHQMAGTTHGKPTKRGEPAAWKTARLTYFEYMPELIRHILHHNNVERVEHLLTLEMRNDGVEPTRRAILEWMMSKGYVSSAPCDLNALRVRSLPRLKAVIHADGLHIFNPWSKDRVLIDKLRYRSDWLVKSGLLERVSRKSKHVDVHVDPMNLRQVWVNLDGLRCLDLITHDPDMREITLHDWCAICEDDKLRAFLDQVNETRAGVESAARRKAVESHAQKELQAEVQRDGKKTNAELNRDRRHHAAVESAAMTGKIPSEKRGAPKERTPSKSSKATPSKASPRVPALPVPSVIASPLEALLDEIR
jgi:hypothetical protein